MSFEGKTLNIIENILVIYNENLLKCIKINKILKGRFSYDTLAICLFIETPPYFFSALNESTLATNGYRVSHFRSAPSGKAIRIKLGSLFSR